MVTRARVLSAAFSLSLLLGATLADAQGAPPAPKLSAACTPACRTGFVCNEGRCVTLCNPPCSVEETCSGSGECVARGGAAARGAWEPTPASPAASQAAARTLFDEGRALLKAGQYERACPKLDAASKLYRGSGVLLNLADCYERAGRTASAWNVFGEAASVAATSGRADDEAEARKRQAALEPRLTRLMVRVTNAPGDLSIRLDAMPLDRAAWGAPVPVDPGMHALRAEAAGRAPWATQVNATQGGAVVPVDVPELPATSASPAAAAPAPAPSPVQPPAPPAPSPTPSAPAPAAATPEPAPAAPPSPAPAPPAPAGAGFWNGNRVVGLSLGFAGVIGLLSGGTIALVAKAKDNAAQTEDPPARHNDSVSAVSMGNTASIVFGVGAGLAAVGVVVWLTGPSTGVHVGTNGTTLTCGGSF